MRKLLFSLSMIFAILICLLSLSACNIQEVFLPNDREINEPFESISINIATADVNIFPAEEEYARVLTYDSDNLYHSVKIVDGTLVVERVDDRNWFERLSPNFSEAEVAVYLPEREYHSLDIDASTGNIQIYSGISFGDVDIELSTGDVFYYATKSESLEIDSSTGDITIANTSAVDVEISSTTGDVRILDIDCNSISVDSGNGGITLGELNIKEKLEIESSTGDIHINMINAGDMELESTTGVIDIFEVECSSLVCESGTGDVNLGSMIASEKIEINSNTGKVLFSMIDSASISINTTTGDVIGTLLSGKNFITSSSTVWIDVPASDTRSEEICKIETTTGRIEISIIEE